VRREAKQEAESVVKQVVQNYRTGKLDVMDVPGPALRAGGVLVAVAASLVSPGTERAMVSLAQASLVGKARQRPDLVRQAINRAQQEGVLTAYQKVMNRLDALTPLGYSCAGTVIDVGDGAAGLQAGDRVACAGAGYANHAEVVFVPQNLVARLPVEAEGQGRAISFEDAAFATLGAIALQGVRQAQPTLGETVVVLGLGLVGQLTAQLLKANGCHVLGMDPNLARGRLAEQLGCDRAVTSGAELLACSREVTGGYGADAVIIVASTKSSAPVELAGEACRDRGRVVALGLVGLDVPRKLFYEKELDLRLSRSYGPGRYDPGYEEHGHDYPIGYVRWTENRNMQAFLALLSQGRVKVGPLVTHRFTVDQAPAAYELISGDRSGEALGVILTYERQAEAAEMPPVVRLRAERTGASPASPALPQGSVLRLGLIGAGTFARGVLLPALRSVDGVALRAVCSASGLSARHVAGKHRAAYCTSEAGHVLGDPEVDAALVATRHGSHAALVVQALQAGKPVFVEKPLAITEGQLAAVVETYNGLPNSQGGATDGMQPPERRALLMVGYNRRFAPLALRMREFLEGAGPLLIHYRVNAGSLPSGSWLQDAEEGGGRIIGEVCHFVDFMQYLTGADPAQVYAMGAAAGAGHDSAAGDNVAVQIAFSDGSVGSILYAAGGDKAFPKERVEALGGGRVAVLDDFRVLETAAGGRRRVWRSRLRQDKGHAAELAAFVHAVRTGGPMPIPFTSLIRTTLATLRIIDALRSGRPQRVDWREARVQQEGAGSHSMSLGAGVDA